MNNKNSYNTKQKNMLDDYLKSVSGKHVTVSDICEHFKEQGNPIGMTTVYRHLERMIKDGLVNKYIIDKNSPACFEYVSEEAHDDHNACFHCKCEKCGKLIHLHCGDLEALQKHLAVGHKFFLNPFKTVFYGLCDECYIKKL